VCNPKTFRDFAAAWAAQEKATLEYGQGDMSKIGSVSSLTDKIAAAEISARKAGFKAEAQMALKGVDACIEQDDLQAAREAVKVAADYFGRAEFDGSSQIKEAEERIAAAQASVAMRQKLAAKMAKKEEKKREQEKRAAEETARREAERQETLAVEKAKREAAKAKQEVVLARCMRVCVRAHVCASVCASVRRVSAI
jgi:hypothetical protein